MPSKALVITGLSCPASDELNISSESGVFQLVRGMGSSNVSFVA